MWLPKGRQEETRRNPHLEFRKKKYPHNRISNLSFPVVIIFDSTDLQSSPRSVIFWKENVLNNPNGIKVSFRKTQLKSEVQSRKQDNQPQILITCLWEYLHLNWCPSIWTARNFVCLWLFHEIKSYLKWNTLMAPS